MIKESLCSPSSNLSPQASPLAFLVLDQRRMPSDAQVSQATEPSEGIIERTSGKSHKSEDPRTQTASPCA